MFVTMLLTVTHEAKPFLIVSQPDEKCPKRDSIKPEHISNDTISVHSPWSKVATFPTR